MAGPRSSRPAADPAKQEPIPSRSPYRPGWRSLHRFLLLTNAPITWPAGLTGAVWLVGVGLVAALWRALLGIGPALVAAGVLCLVTALDLGILWALPRLRLSFGPIGAQLLLLAAPRMLVVALAAPLALHLGAEWGLGLLGAIQIAASVAFAWGALYESGALAVTRVTLPALATGKHPLRLLHISDIHVERFGRREERLLSLVQQAAPDLILLTGDYVNLSFVDDPRAHRDARRVLASLAAPHGVYAVLGSPAVDRNSAPLFRDLPIRLLRDEHVTLRLGQGRALTLIGIECTHDRTEDARRVLEIASQAPEGSYRILLYHTPESALAAPRAGIDLYLCGHTHGGQIRLPMFGALVTSSILGKRFEMGRYQVGQTSLFVSRGVGMEGMGAPRVRFLCPPEITLITLTGQS